jgi:transmembrane sensor
LKNDVAPGGNRATLTLAGGRTIHLDSAAYGLLAEEGAATIVKTAEGQIRYSNASTLMTAEIGMNTMLTPRGGQYQLTLPDGSNVWLNAESSITYPTAFNGNERRVRLTGEAYFEVAKKTSQRFIVETMSDTITVLGTVFNVNAYTDEAAVKTSLLEGSVKINNKILKPGQAYYKGSIQSTDLERDLAWKNGLFNFDGADLQTVLRQLARWYDIEVAYEGTYPDMIFDGEIGRDLKLSQVLKVLAATGVAFTIDGK